MKTAHVCRVHFTIATVGCALGFAAMPVLGQVVIEGVNDDANRNILAHLALDDEPCDAIQQRVQQRYRAAPAEIRIAMEALGYYQVTVESSLSFEPDCWAATFRVAPGEPVRVRHAELTIRGEAQQDPAFQPLFDQLAAMVDSRLRHSRYDTFKQRLTELAASRGYFDGDFESSRLDVYPAELAADIHIAYDSGPRYQLGDVQFQQDVFAEDFLQRYVDFASGDDYQSDRITSLYRGLMDSRYFDAVQITPMPTDARDLQVPIIVRLTPDARKSYSAGLGFSTDTGPNIRLGYEDRRLNEHGHQLKADVSVSAVESSAGLVYRIPRRDPRKEWLSLYGGLKTEDTDTFDSSSGKIGIRSVRKRRNSWLETRFVEVAYETFDIAGERSRSRLLMPGISWAKTSAVESPRPRRGYRLNLEVKGASEYLGSDTAFIQVLAHAKAIMPMPANARLITRAEVGFTSKDALQELPPSVRFFAGGDNSVRGYEFESLGPRNDDGEVIGGSHKLVASVEYDFPIADNWSIAAFFDAGNAFNTKEFDVNQSVGLGVRWYSPIGPFRLDLAHPIDDDAQIVRLHISLGADL